VAHIEVYFNKFTSKVLDEYSSNALL